MMNARISAPLEVIRRAPAKRTRKPALVFVHGAYVGAWCWDVFFLDYFARRGFSSYAFSLRGHGGSVCEGSYAALGLDDYVADLDRVLADCDRPLVLIGHSMGGLIVTRWLAQFARTARSRVLGAVLMAPVPTLGLTPAMMGLALRSPMLLAELNLVQYGQPRLSDLTHVRRALFSVGVDDALVRGYFARMQLESQRAILEMSMLHLWPTPAAPRLPMLVLGAADDGLFAPGQVRASAFSLGADCEILPNMAHAMMLEPQWQRVADRIAEHVEGLDPTT